MNALTLTRPDDWHLHLRDGDAMRSVIGHTAAQFSRAIVMPNLSTPVTTTEAALAYRDRILAALGPGESLTPLMTLYLTNATTPQEIDRAREAGIVACKLYPAGATTNSDRGVTDIEALDPVLEAMAEARMPLLVHGEVTTHDVDVFDREAVFLDDVLTPLVARHRDLKVVLEHVTTAEGVAFVRRHAPRVGGTITPHHLLLNRNHLLVGGVRPHHYCLPILKREEDRHALIDAATSGEAAFFLGTDSAPHAQSAKENACGCAGIYSAHAALALYAEVFDAVGALAHFEAFASLNGPRFYGLAPNTDTLTLVRETWRVPERYDFGGQSLIPFRAREDVHWRVGP